MSLALKGAAAIGAGWDTNAWPPTVRAYNPADTNLPYMVEEQLWANVSNVLSTNILDGVSTLITNVFLSNIYAWSNTADHVATNLPLMARDVRDYDAFLAMLERYYALSNIGGVDEPDDPTTTYYAARYYRYHTQTHDSDGTARFNLGKVAEWFRTGTDDGNDNIHNWVCATNEFQYWTPSNLFTYVGAPIGWLSKDRLRDVSGEGPCWTRVTNNTWTISAPAGGTVTNSVTDMWNQAHTISGTNGQVITKTITNAVIEAGFTTCDYGHRYFTNIMGQLIFTRQTDAWSGNVSNQYSWTATSTQSWALAKADCAAATPSVASANAAPARYNTGAATDHTTYTSYTATAVSRKTMMLASGIPTQVLHSVKYYVLAGHAGIDTFDNQGDPLVDAEWYEYEQSAGTTSAAIYSAYIFSTDFPTNWCDKPTPGGGTESKGYLIGDRMHTIVWTNGFLYY